MGQPPSAGVIAEENESGEGRRIHLNVKSYVQHGEIDLQSYGHRHQSGKAYTIGHLAPVDMDSLSR